MKRGFTLLEMLVASCLLGILVTILTMIFNQSAIAWRTGKGSVSDMATGQMNLSGVSYVADSVIPGLKEGSDTICTLSPWDDAEEDDSGNPTFATRGVCRMTDLGGTYGRVNSSILSRMPSAFSSKSKQTWSLSSLGSMQSHAVRNYIVGVKSAGPDGSFDTSDDITTWPEQADLTAK